MKHAMNAPGAPSAAPSTRRGGKPRTDGSPLAKSGTCATDEPADIGDTALRLAVAVDRLNARLRKEAGEADKGMTLSQIAMLRRLEDKGPLSVSALAAAEHVSQQAITQRLALFDPTGYVACEPDPSDRRRKLIGITPTGRALLASFSANGETWLAQALDRSVPPEEQPSLEAVIDLLNRLASAAPQPPNATLPSDPRRATPQHDGFRA